MHTRSTDVICSMPALELRRLLSYLGRRDTFSIERVLRVHPMTLRAANKLIGDLRTSRYIEPSERATRRVPLWRLTISGRALSLASAARPIKRATADRLVREFLDRIDALNADKGLKYRVTEAVVFGSYLGTGETIGDVDVGIRLKSRVAPGESMGAKRKERVAIAEKDGRVFRSWPGKLYWPDREVWLRLKARSRGISLHDMDEDGIFDRRSLQTRIIYADGRRA